MMFRYAPSTPSINRNSLEDYEIRNGPGNYSPTYPYIAGQLATEYLVASVGFQKMLDIWTDFKSTKSFEKSFMNVIGISKEAFYEKFEKSRVNLGLPPVTWKLVCLTNTLISELPKTTPPCNYNNSEGNPNPSTSPAPSPTPSFTPPPVDRNSNLDGQGCSHGEPEVKNGFGTFVCTELANGNNLWKKKT